MVERGRWRVALAAALGAVAVVAVVVGGVQLAGPPPSAVPAGPVTRPDPGLRLPGASDPDALVPPVGATLGPPVFPPSAVVVSPGPAAPAGGPASTRPRTSGESQYEWGCRKGYITEGC